MVGAGVEVGAPALVASLAAVSDAAEFDDAGLLLLPQPASIDKDTSNGTSEEKNASVTCEECQSVLPDDDMIIPAGGWEEHAHGSPKNELCCPASWLKYPGGCTECYMRMLKPIRL
jgi:hypothetical protein